jgi:thioredoxin reductase (NADPH)
MTDTSTNDSAPSSPPVSEADNVVQLIQAGRFPVLDDAQLEILRHYGSEQEVAADEVLFAEGDESYDLIVVLEGEIAIVPKAARPQDPAIAALGPRQFLGEISLLTGQRAFLGAVARTAGRVLRVPVDQVREIMAQRPLLSELLLRTFLIRHSNLTRIGSGLTLIGSRFDPDTRRLLEVLARNRLSSKWVDLEEDPDAEAMLRELHVSIDALPIVIVPGPAAGKSLQSSPSRRPRPVRQP